MSGSLLGSLEETAVTDLIHGFLSFGSASFPAMLAPQAGRAISLAVGLSVAFRERR
jgi:hypothetical protein